MVGASYTKERMAWAIEIADGAIKTPHESLNTRYPMRPFRTSP